MRVLGHPRPHPRELSREVAVHVEHRPLRDLQVLLRRGAKTETAAPGNNAGGIIEYLRHVYYAVLRNLNASSSSVNFKVYR